MGSETIHSIFLNISQVKDLKELSKYCTDVFKQFPLIEIINITTSFSESDSELLNNYFVKIFIETLNSPDFTFLKDMTFKDHDAYSEINHIMTELHYNNGKPLACDEYNYFDDCGHEFWEFYHNDPIYDFINDENCLYIRMNVTSFELKNRLKEMYDGINYEALNIYEYE